MPAGRSYGTGARRGARGCPPSVRPVLLPVVDAVRSRRAFAALSASRRRGRSGPVWVVRADAPSGTPEASGDPVRVAYAIGRAVGGAVARNRLRRRLRALVRELDGSGALPGGLYLVGAAPEALDRPADALRRHLAGALDGVR